MLAARLERAAAYTPEITVAVGPPATFLPGAPVVYLKVTGAGLPWLHALHRELAGAVGAAADGQPFVPHVTLVRGLERSALLGCLAAARATAWRVTVPSVHLLSMTEHSGTWTWRELRQFALAG
jgi:2'-5' RNA ligase